MLKKISRYLKPKADDVFVELGCGKGRVVFFYNTFKFKKMIGIELKKELAEIAKENLEALKIRNNPIEIIHGDAANVDLTDGTLFFLNNPFGFKTLSSVLTSIKNSFRTHPRKVRIIYLNAVNANLLNEQPWLEIEEKISDRGAGDFIWRSV